MTESNKNRTHNSTPAFPAVKPPDYGWDEMPGMSLRDYLAGQALQGYCANADLTSSLEKAQYTYKESREIIAEFCYRQADAMLQAREASNE